MKKVLFVAYPFPPAGGPGVKRTLKFIKFLPQLGWEPIVLTVKNGNHDVLDASLLKDVPGNCEVIRAFTAETILMRGLKVKEKRNALNRIDRGKSGKSDWLKRKSKRVYHWLGRGAGVPDARVLWVPSALVMGIKAILQRDVKAIYSTGPTFTDHVVAYLLKKVTKRKLIVDFRDAWIANPTYVRRAGWARRVEETLEKKVVVSADFVVSTTHGITNDFIKRYPYLDPTKFITIPNGYDLDDFAFDEEDIKARKNGVFTIVHTGTLRYERSPKKFLEAIRSLTSENGNVKRQIKVVFVGQNFAFNDGCHIEDYIKELGLEGIVQVTGFVSRTESLRFQRSADVLLLIIGVVPEEALDVYGLSGKAFDYAMAGKPVLALAQEGATASFVKKANIGIVVEPEKVDLIRNALEIMHQKFIEGQSVCQPDQNILAEYDFRELSKRLAGYLAECV
jgi:glycosyltransferase involved in cell wall biosynthesis